jgi:hypothetical protein
MICDVCQLLYENVTAETFSTWKTQGPRRDVHQGQYHESIDGFKKECDLCSLILEQLPEATRLEVVETWRDWSTRSSFRNQVSAFKTQAILGARDLDEGTTFNEVFNSLEKPKIRYSWHQLADSRNVLVRFSFPTTTTSEETIEYTIQDNKYVPVARRRYKRLLYEVIIHLSQVEGQPHYDFLMDEDADLVVD